MCSDRNFGYHPRVTHDDPTLREELQATALRRVADLSAQRAALLRQAEELLKPLEEAVVEAARVGAPRRRTQELAQVGALTFYGWLEEAGVVVRPKKRSRKRHAD